MDCRICNAALDSGVPKLLSVPMALASSAGLLMILPTSPRPDDSPLLVKLNNGENNTITVIQYSITQPVSKLASYLNSVTWYICSVTATNIANYLESQRVHSRYFNISYSVYNAAFHIITVAIRYTK